jgi:hypothetical protein
MKLCIEIMLYFFQSNVKEHRNIIHPKEKAPPPMTETTAPKSAGQQEIERHFRWNFLVNILDGASFWFGMSFMASAIILPL